MCLLFVLLLTVGFCEGVVKDLSVLRNGQYVSCPNELCPASEQVFRCTIDGQVLQWRSFFNDTSIGQSLHPFSTGNAVNSSVTQGNFTFILTNNTIPTVTSIAIVNYGMSRSIGSDTLRCTDVLAVSSLECSLIQKDEPDSCDPALLNDVVINDDNTSTVNINVTWSASDCAVIYHYKLNPPIAYVSEGTTDMTFVSITGVPADGTLYNVTITPIDFLGTRGPTCQTSSFFLVNLVPSPSSCPSPISTPSCSPNMSQDCPYFQTTGIIIFGVTVVILALVIVLLLVLMIISIRCICKYQHEHILRDDVAKPI